MRTVKEKYEKYIDEHSQPKSIVALYYRTVMAITFAPTISRRGKNLICTCALRMKKDFSERKKEEFNIKRQDGF